MTLLWIYDGLCVQWQLQGKKYGKLKLGDTNIIDYA